MNKKLLSILLVVGLGAAACDKIAPPSENGTSSDAEVAPAAVASTPAPSDFPEGIVPAFPYKIRSKAADGEVRKMVVEFKAGDVTTVDKQLESLLVSKGYKRYKTQTNPDGGVVGDYGASNNRRVTVTTSSGNGLTLADGSLGIVYFIWR